MKTHEISKGGYSLIARVLLCSAHHPQVWLEKLPAAASIVSAVGSTERDLSGFAVTVSIERASSSGATGTGGLLQVQLTLDDVVHAGAGSWQQTVECTVEEGSSHCLLAVALPSDQRRPWTPDTPHLYHFTCTLLQQGVPIDSVKSYAALRTVGKLSSLESSEHGGGGVFSPSGQRASERAVTRLALNGNRFYLIGTLDQGFWPGGVYTAPTDEALASDLVTLKSLGFNSLRKHQKIEPRRFYYHCDRLGIAVIQDFPGGRSGFGNVSVDAQFRHELRQMVKRTAAHPSVIAFSIYNEGGPAWNQTGGAEYIKDVVATVKAADKESSGTASSAPASKSHGNVRLVDAASGEWARGWLTGWLTG